MTNGDESLWELGKDDGLDETASQQVSKPKAEPGPDGEPSPTEGDGARSDAEGPPEGAERAAESPFDEEEEEAVGTSEAGRAASDALVSLGRAARSYLLYEPDNEAIRNFLDDMRTRFDLYLKNYGPLRLSIRPWEMVLGSEVVYLNRDRERSLSFRLFRDGVRRISIQPDVAWEEITQFLGILSIRYVGIRQQEDDIVTLLWKAGFQHIEVDSVEGFVPEDDETEFIDDALLGELGELGEFEGGGMDSMGMLAGAAPEGFDVPWPEYSQRVPLRWVEVDEESLQEAMREDSNVMLPHQCVRLLREILEVACNPVEPLDLDEAIPILREIRDFLLSEGLLSSLLEVMQIIQALPFRSKDLERKEELLEAFTDERALSRIIRSVPAGARDVPDELQALVASIPGNPVPLLLNILRKERGNTARWVTRSLLVEVGRSRVDELVQAIYGAEPPVAADILQVVALVDIDRGPRLALDLVVDSDVEVQLQCLPIIEHADYNQTVGQRLSQLLDASSLEVRLRALRMLEVHQERWAFHAVASRLQRNANREMEGREVDALATAMVRIWEERAFHTFLAWIKPKGILERVLLGQPTLKRAAVTGLSYIPGEQSEEYIRLVAKQSHDELHTHCMQCLVRQRRLMVRTDDEL
jgi:hypothetical protein